MSDIRAWLDELGFGQYAEAFEANEIGVELLPRLTDDALEKLGVKVMGHRIRMLDAIAALHAEPSAPPATTEETRPDGPEAERRQLTVMFCDLVGSTALSEGMDPEDLRALMSAYQAACGTVVDHYDGHVAQYLGDGLMIYFGWPHAHENDAERAVRAALEIIDQVHALTGPVALAVRIGIATGPVVVGATGKGDAAVPKAAVGETPNIAARLQGLAAPDQIVIGPVTHRLAGGNFEYQDTGRHDLKGVTEPIQAWRVVRSARISDRFAATHGDDLSPLVGRDAEIAMLMDRWQQALGGEGQVVILSGEAGIGKSRIGRELRGLTANDSPIRLRYQCSPLHTDSAYQPIIDQLEYAAGFTQSDTPEAKLDKLETVIQISGVDIASVGALFAGLMNLPQARYPAIEANVQTRKKLTLEALVDQVLALAGRAPVLMVFEDAHWIDPTTQEALDLLIPTIEAARVMVVLTCRPEYTSPWTLGHVTHHALNRFGRRQGEDLVVGVTGGKTLPDEVLEQILTKSDGVPIFVEELTKTVIEAGYLVDEGDQLRLDGALPSLAVPATLQDSLMARLDRQHPDKEVAQIAACIGRAFDFELLASVAPVSRDALTHALSRLVDNQLIVARGASPDISYRFKHALVRDAAYESLLRTRRQTLHAEIGRALEDHLEAAPNQNLEAIAYHFARGASWPKAVQYSREAAVGATRAFAIDEALSLYQHGLDSALNLDGDAQARDVMAIREARYELFFLVGDFSNARQEWQEALLVARQIKDGERECAALAGLATAYMWEEDFVSALQHANEAARAAEALGAKEHLANAHNTIASVRAVSGELDIARNELSETINIARSVGSVAFESAALYMGANVENWQGHFDKAINLSSTGARIAKEHDLLATFLRCNYAHAISLTGKGRYDDALARFNEGFQLAEKLGDEAFIPRYANGLGWLHIESQSFGPGFELNSRCAEITKDRKHGVGVEMTAFAELNMADVLFAQGDVGAAAELLEGVHRICQDPGGHTWMKWRYATHMFLSLGRVALVRGDVARAEMLASQCQEIAIRTNSRKYIAKSQWLQGDIAVAKLDRPGAERLYVKALAMATETGHPSLTLGLHAAQARLHADAGRDDLRREAYAAARTIVDHVRAQTNDPTLRSGLDGAPLIQEIDQNSTAV